jgi:hypothetical protein
MPDRFDANGLMAIAALLLTDHDEVKSLFLQVMTFLLIYLACLFMSFVFFRRFSQELVI